MILTCSREILLTMSVASFQEFCSLLAQSHWTENEIERIQRTAERRQEYLTKKLDENLCVVCTQYTYHDVKCNQRDCGEVSPGPTIYLNCIIFQKLIYNGLARVHTCS